MASAAADPMMSVIVREVAGAGNEAELAVVRAGGRVDRHIALIDGFAATMRGSTAGTLARLPQVHSVTPDGRVQLMADAGDASSSFATMFNVTSSIGAHDVWNSGITGKGVDIALIDSGVVPVKGLDMPNKVAYGPDLSFESQSDKLRHLDTFGHGTHMASIMGGLDPDHPAIGAAGTGSKLSYAHPDYFVGVAPEARVVSIKVAAANGATDVSQVIAAIDWVVQNRQKHGLNIRVLNLSFGTDGTQSYLLDPLAYAAEVAWHSGLVVVVAAGNAGFGSPALNNPAYNPFVIAVGATDMMRTLDPKDDVNATFSSTGDAQRRPDLAAPGRSIQGLRAPGSFLDHRYPEARVQGRLFKGSGTSQAAAIMSGAAALVLQRRPELKPDQVKRLLVASATTIKSSEVLATGDGTLNVKKANGAGTPSELTSLQTFARGTGLGSLDLARGSVVVQDDGVELRGEVDIMGKAFVSATWAPLAAAGSTWAGGDWNGSTWSGSTWSGSTWSGSMWSGSTWSGSTWSGSTWSGSTWSGSTWSGSTWSGDGWCMSVQPPDGWLGVTWS